MPLKSNCNHIVFIMEGKQKKNTFRFENTSLRFTIVEHIVLRIINHPPHAHKYQKTLISEYSQDRRFHQE